jgi:hypothetical protein
MPTLRPSLTTQKHVHLEAAGMPILPAISLRIVMNMIENKNNRVRFATFSTLTAIRSDYFKTNPLSVTTHILG